MLFLAALFLLVVWCFVAYADTAIVQLALVGAWALLLLSGVVSVVVTVLR